MPGKSYNLDSKGANRSVNNKQSKVTYYGADAAVFVTGPYTTGQAGTSAILGSGTSVKNRSITERLVENFSSRYGTGFGKLGPTIPEFEITTVAGGIQLPVSTGSPSKLETKSGYKKPKITPKTDVPQELPPGNPNEYDWNLPPHKWSLPTLPTVVNAAHYKDNGFTKKPAVSDKYRRGRLWWKANPMISTVDANGNTSQLSAGDANRKYGFQFMWNPETVGTQVSVQLDATPSVQDRFLGVTGAFPATQTVSFTIRLDRTNDFACAALNLPILSDIARSTSPAGDVISVEQIKQFAKFYNKGDSFAAADKEEKLYKKLIDLFQRGTIADIEYLYRAINGPGPGGAGSEWMNGRGIKTADIGWLMPTLLHVDVGPLSYDGYVTALQVNHLSFTPNMTPIRSDLTISLNVLATASLTTYESGSSVSGRTVRTAGNNQITAQ